MNTIEQQVMGRVALIYAARRLASRTALKCYALFISFCGIVSLVSVPHVLANLEQEGFGGFMHFTTVAILKTELLVQLALLIGTLALLSLFVDIVRSFSRSTIVA